MKIAIIGAGFAGLAAAKVLTEFGHQVSVFDRTPDVGGVWSQTRRYPGVATQNNKGTYAFSDFPMPRSYPEWPSGAQVQSYLADYVTTFGLADKLRLNTEVQRVSASGDGWDVSSRPVAAGKAEATDVSEHFDFVVVANGIFSEPLIPTFDGLSEFVAAGGRVCHTSQFTELDDAAGRNVVVVGYGKSSCDIAVALSATAASTTIVARELLWKMPKKLGNVLNYKYLMLSRMGEGLFKYLTPKGFERFLHGPGRPLRNSMLGSVQSVSVRQLKLKKLGLVPDGSFEDIARSTVSLSTDGLYDRLADGRIGIHRDTTIAKLTVEGGKPFAQLSNGEVIAADVIVCGTGFQQQVPFFDDEIQRALLDEQGNFELYRQIMPLRVALLAFAGYNSSFFSPLSAEVAAWWIADYINGTIPLPPDEQMQAHVRDRLAWMQERTEGKHARGTNIIPFSMHNIDEMLADLGLNVSATTRLNQWLMPVNPASYRKIGAKLRARHAKTLPSKNRVTVTAPASL